MIRYRLDELGASQFEWLVQSLLKAILGPGLESWGGRGDQGIDAYFAGPLRFPDKAEVSNGSFVFQVKFVEHANAAGAKVDGNLKDAIGKENHRIRDRIKSGIWSYPKHYVFISNAPLTPEFRAWARKSFAEVLGETTTHFLSGKDVCDFLDQEPEVRYSFPQLLGLRDLSELISEALSREDVQKSESAIDLARDIAPVFVPTAGYFEAWRVLNEHRFVVLEGPAEMGKTAIAWMIALSQISKGWQAIYCRDPQTFFKLYDKDRSQVFVADDAFGLTEYDTNRSQQWEKELHLVTRRLDPKHWLIWTSRKHILERAMKNLDFKRHQPTFPDPNAVLVNAAQLTPMEKALILYRHVKRAGLPMLVRVGIRKFARKLSADPNFTPERIRRISEEVLPKYRTEATPSVDALEALQKEMQRAVDNPTERSTTTYRALPMGHKWALVAILEAGAYASTPGTREAFDRLCPAGPHESFESAIDQLTEAFVKISRPYAALDEFPEEAEQIGWIHPSYRDVVIDQLASDPDMASRFIANTNLAGINLILANGGGHGDRRLPFLTSPKAWQALADRALALSRSLQPPQLASLLALISDALETAQSEDSKERLNALGTDVCAVALRRWAESSAVLNPEILNIYLRATTLFTPLCPAPDLRRTWNAALSSFQAEIDSVDDPEVLWPMETPDFLQIAKIVKSLEPRFLVQQKFPEELDTYFDRLMELARSGEAADLRGESPGDLRGESARLSQLALCADLTAELVPRLRDQATELRQKLNAAASSASREADSLEDSDENYDPDPRSPSADDIDQLFQDL
jgi:hypothetical protein